MDRTEAYLRFLWGPTGPPAAPEKIDLSAFPKPSNTLQARIRWRQHYRPDGTEKTAYKTSWGAEFQAGKLQKASRYTPTPGRELHAYLCETCGKWHIGHMDST